MFDLEKIPRKFRLKLLNIFAKSILWALGIVGAIIAIVLTLFALAPAKKWSRGEGTIIFENKYFAISPFDGRLLDISIFENKLLLLSSTDNEQLTMQLPNSKSMRIYHLLPEGASIKKDQTIAEGIDVESISIKAFIDIAHASKIRPGQKAKYYLKGSREQIFFGTVRSVLPIADKNRIAVLLKPEVNSMHSYSQMLILDSAILTVEVETGSTNLLGLLREEIL